MAKRKTNKKTKPYTLAGFWKNINSVAPKCLNVDDFDQKDALSELAKIVDEVNASPIPRSIGNLFVGPYLEEDKFKVDFSIPETLQAAEVNKPVSYKSYDLEESPRRESTISINSLALFNYVESFKDIPIPEENDISVASFKEKRQFAFMKEVAKLPDPYFVYLAVLQELAYCNDVVSVEDREGNFHESDAGFYLSLLWAFKEFEVFYLRAQNRSLRADYGIIWHEGEWVQDSKRSRGYV
jgi:hypothetical protein